MIVVNEEAPRWLRELARFLPLKSLIFIHGNVLDQVSFPVQRVPGGEPTWTDDDLPGFLARYLIDIGFQVVGFLDPVDGLTFPAPDMESLYHVLRRGQIPGPPGGKTAGNDRPNPETSPASPSRPTTTDWVGLLQDLRAVVRNPHRPAAFVFNLASRLVTSPEHMSREERQLFTRVLKAALESADLFDSEGRHFRNVILMVCDKLNDLPPFLFVNNPRARSIIIDKPDSRERSRFLERTHGAFFGAEGPRPTEELTDRFAALTEGLTNYELMSLVHLSRREGLEARKIEALCHRYKYGVKESEWDKIGRARLAGAEELLRSRVKGQDQAVSRVLDIVRRARLGLAAGQSAGASRPRGVLFFAGPTGVGKTELAKGLAELLFGEEDRCLRFDMSEYAAPQADERLLGAPPGYLGYAEGGQLTNALKAKPFSVLLFDEIEKAHGGVLDKFLQILDDGRLTDGQGETVYFSETIIIFTSNLGAVTREDGPGGRRMLVHPGMPFPEMREIILEAIRDHFNFILGRPEILNRFGDNFVVFDFIKPPVDEEIVDLMLSRLALAARNKWKIELIFGPATREVLIGLARKNLHHGGRGIRNVVDSALVNALTRWLFDNLLDGSEGAKRVRVENLRDLGPDAKVRFQIEAQLLEGSLS